MTDVAKQPWPAALPSLLKRPACTPLPAATQVTFVTDVAKHRGRGSVAKRRTRIERFLELNVERAGGQAWELLRLLLPHVRGWGWGGAAGAARSWAVLARCRCRCHVPTPAWRAISAP